MMQGDERSKRESQPRRNSPERGPDLFRHLRFRAGVKVFGETHLLTGDGLEKEDVAARELGHELDRGFGQDLVFVGVAVVAEPETQELLVDVLRGLATGESVARREEVSL